MKRVSAEIAASEPRIDVLINNAGAIFGARQPTEDGLKICGQTGLELEDLWSDGTGTLLEVLFMGAPRDPD
jgi:NAD(P)-dependent dehydrogenase (short-subunit alcohol dehydrogenase family)